MNQSATELKANLMGIATFCMFSVSYYHYVDNILAGIGAILGGSVTAILSKHGYIRLFGEDDTE